MVAGLWLLPCTPEAVSVSCRCAQQPRPGTEVRSCCTHTQSYRRYLWAPTTSASQSGDSRPDPGPGTPVETSAVDARLRDCADWLCTCAWRWAPGRGKSRHIRVLSS